MPRVCREARQAPRSERLDCAAKELQLAGVARDARGYVAVSNRVEASTPDICAIGERAGSPQVDHVPFDNSAASGTF
jgi:pyruvate/2-oxoglutarate dehydrogenase complex dihydrolipoamide dehydrogenase (E3) component